MIGLWQGPISGSLGFIARVVASDEEGGGGLQLVLLLNPVLCPGCGKEPYLCLGFIARVVASEEEDGGSLHLVLLLNPVLCLKASLPGLWQGPIYVSLGFIVWVVARTHICVSRLYCPGCGKDPYLCL